MMRRKLRETNRVEQINLKHLKLEPDHRRGVEQTVLSVRLKRYSLLPHQVAPLYHK